MKKIVNFLVTHYEFDEIIEENGGTIKYFEDKNPAEIGSNGEHYKLFFYEF